LADFAAFQRCFGPEPDALCRIAFDCNDADGEIHLDDYAVFYARFIGESAPPCAMVFVPGGDFNMGDTFDEGLSSEQPVHTVHLSPYYIDAYEVTNEQYAAALNWAYTQGGLIRVAGGVVYKAGSGTSYPYCDTYEDDSDSRIHFSGGTFTVTSGKGDHPMVEVSWYGAAAYANWRSGMEGRTASYSTSRWECDFAADGYRLPTEAEWEYAARGGEHDPYYRFPWGDTVDGSMANYMDSGDPYESGFHPWTTPVGYYDGGQTPPGADMVNGYGLYDMAGNVWEWCNDWYSSTYYSSSPGSNPTGPVGGSHRVIRGGSWDYAEDNLRCAHREHYYSDYRYGRNGFRLALDSD
ncbi:MAG: formylglycine-generating enzyme family protein, partial [Planctomycetota bacterium]|jgi:formylglycine-generating enzyme required for sulfatase activity